MEEQELLLKEAAALECLIWTLTASQFDKLALSEPARLQKLGLSLAKVFAWVSDEGLLLLIQRGLRGPKPRRTPMVELAFQELMVNRYATYLLRWCRQWKQSTETALDLIADFQLRFWEGGIGDYRPSRNNRTNFRSYLRTAARNYLTSLGRRRRAECLTNHNEPATDEDSPEQLAAAQELRERVEEALLKLPDKQAQMMRLHLLGKDNPTIAEMLRVPYHDVANGLHWVRNRLEVELNLPHRCPPEHHTR